jgi:hypothetical protein
MVLPPAPPSPPSLPSIVLSRACSLDLYLHLRQQRLLPCIKQHIQLAYLDINSSVFSLGVELHRIEMLVSSLVQFSTSLHVCVGRVEFMFLLIIPIFMAFLFLCFENFCIWAVCLLLGLGKVVKVACLSCFLLGLAFKSWKLV